MSQTAPPAPQALPARLVQRVLDLGHLVRFSHSIFALPFALASAACAAARAPLTFPGSAGS